MWLKSVKSLAVAMAASGALSAGAVSASDFVILDSDASGIEPGIVVAAAAQIVIPDGATVVMISPSGETLMVQGPYEGVVASAGSVSDGSSTLERLTTSRGQDTKVLGAVRSFTFNGGSVTE